MPQALNGTQWSAHTRHGCLENGRLWRLNLNADSTAGLTQAQAEALVRCYAGPEKLIQLSAESGHRPDELFADMLPTKAHLKSGDFGEILTWRDLQTRDPQPRFPLYRWWLRATRNDTVRGVDLLGYALRPDSPSPDDLLVLCEVKTRAKTKNKKVARLAYDGVMKDYATRLTNQLLFQSKLLLQQGADDTDRHAFTRFWSRGVTPYRRRLVAAVVHERRTWADEYLDALPRVHTATSQTDVEVHVTCIDDLTDWIGRVHLAAISHAAGLSA